MREGVLIAGGLGGAADSQWRSSGRDVVGAGQMRPIRTTGSVYQGGFLPGVY